MQSNQKSSRVRLQNPDLNLKKEDHYEQQKQRTKTAVDLYNYDSESDQSTISSLNQNNYSTQFSEKPQAKNSEFMKSKIQIIQQSITQVAQQHKDAILQSFSKLEIPLELIDNGEGQCGVIIKKIKEAENKINLQQQEVKKSVNTPNIMLKGVEVLGKMKYQLTLQLDKLIFGIKELRSSKKIENQYCYSYQLLEQALLVISYIKKDVARGQELTDKLITTYTKLNDLQNSMSLDFNSLLQKDSNTLAKSCDSLPCFSDNNKAGQQGTDIIKFLGEFDTQGNWDIANVTKIENIVQIKQEINAQQIQLRTVKENLEIYEKKLSNYIRAPALKDEAIKILKPALWILHTSIKIKEKTLICLEQIANKIIEQQSLISNQTNLIKKDLISNQQFSSSQLYFAGKTIVEPIRDRQKQEILNFIEQKIDEAKSQTRKINSTHQQIKNLAQLLIKDIYEDFHEGFKQDSNQLVRVQKILRLLPGSLKSTFITEFQEQIEMVSKGDELIERKVSLLSQIQQILVSFETKQANADNILIVNKKHEEDYQQLKSIINLL